jgi:pentatricopeptide repeat protein
MKKVLFIILFIGIHTVNSLIAGQLLFSPEKSNPEETITINYIPDGKYFMDEILYARIYAFNSENTQATAYEFMLSDDSENNRYTGSFTVPANVVFLMAKISNGKIIDDNNSMFWDIMFYKSGKAVKNAHLKNGLSYLGNLPENMNRNINFKRALEHFEKEIELYPDNIPAQVGYVSLMLDLQKIDYKEYSSRIEKIVLMSFDNNNENEVRAISRALKSLNRIDEASKLEKEFAKNHPKSQLAEEIFLAELAKADSLEEFSDGVLEYLGKFPVTDNRERIYSALVSGYLQTGEVDKVISILNKMENVPAGAYAQIAFALINDEELKNITTEYRIQKAVNLMNIAIYKIKKDNIDFKPSYMTLKEWELRNRIRYAGLLEEYGQILMATEQYNEALNKFSAALDVYKDDAPVSLYENIINLCLQTHRSENAYETALLAIKNSAESEYILDKIRELHKELVKPSSIESVIVSAKAEAEKERFKKISFERMKMSFSDVPIKNINGEKTSLAELKGKVIVLMFWSSWCDPCDDALAGLDELSDEYKDESSVYIAAVNIWENEDDKPQLVKDFFKDSGVKFNNLIDDNNLLPYELGISGLPTTCYIGKSGDLEYIERGYNNVEDFIMKSVDRINILLNDK